VISGSSASLNGASASFTCTAPLSAGQFTVPVPVLLALPAGSGMLSLTDAPPLVKFSATGLDLGYLTSGVSFSESVQYQ